MSAQAHQIANLNRVNDASVAAARLLIVDDVPDNRIILTRRFERQGFEIAEASGGVEALDLIQRKEFDVVLLDVMMPDMSGIDVLRRIRQRFSSAALPVIMVTANALSENVVEALDSGANDYITKPVDFKIALSRVNVQVDRRRADAELRRANRSLTEATATLRSEVADQSSKLAKAHAVINEEAARRAESEDKVVYLAHHDPLTSLPNRFTFDQTLQAACKATLENGMTISVLFVDLDGFKLVNDTLGHDVGDALLCEVARLLSEVASPTDSVARLGGDEFGVIHLSTEPETTAVALAEQIVQAISACRSAAGHDVFVGASVGVAIRRDAELDATALLKQADLAMYQAKSSGGGAHRFFEPEMQKSAQRRRELEIDLRKAASRFDLDLHYQPIVDLATRRVVGLEALMRWDHPERGQVSAQEFVGLAEETGLISPMGEWALRKACADAAHWRDDIRIAVNLSPRQFRNRGLVTSVVNALAASGLQPSRLELEITETAFLQNAAQTLTMLNQLRELGVLISLDDFGAGYTGFGYLRDFRFDKLKIDQSFVRNMPKQVESAAIVRAALGLGANLGMTTIGEGVERLDELECLMSEGCVEAQGFLFGEAKPRDAIPDLIKTIESAQWTKKELRRVQSGA
jgi:diguanylate cyclase (GGDEF)-like protein